MPLSLVVGGEQSPTHGLIRLDVGDPDSSVADVTFSIIGGDGVRRERRPDVRTGSRYESTVLLHESHSTRVEPVITLVDGTLQRAIPAMFGLRFEPLAMAGTEFDWFSTGGAPYTLWVSLGRGSLTSSWRCWAARGRWPTTDDTSVGPLDQRYLRVDTLDDVIVDDAFDMTAEPGSWRVLAVPYNGRGQPGSRRAVQVEVPS